VPVPSQSWVWLDRNQRGLRRHGRREGRNGPPRRRPVGIRDVIDNRSTCRPARLADLPRQPALRRRRMRRADPRRRRDFLGRRNTEVANRDRAKRFIRSKPGVTLAASQRGSAAAVDAFQVRLVSARRPALDVRPAPFSAAVSTATSRAFGEFAASGSRGNVTISTLGGESAASIDEVALMRAVLMAKTCARIDPLIGGRRASAFAAPMVGHATPIPRLCLERTASRLAGVV